MKRAIDGSIGPLKNDGGAEAKNGRLTASWQRQRGILVKFYFENRQLRSWKEKEWSRLLEEKTLLVLLSLLATSMLPVTSCFSPAEHFPSRIACNQIRAHKWTVSSQAENFRPFETSVGREIIKRKLTTPSIFKCSSLASITDTYIELTREKDAFLF